MPNPSMRRSDPLSVAGDIAVSEISALADLRESRATRRKRETRTKLLEAALALMAEKGMEGVAINEITEAADVGFGSFYNHFESKEAIYAALTAWVFEAFADSLDRQVSHLEDPAEVIAVCTRHTLLRARREPVWGRFLLREGFSTMTVRKGLGQRLWRDVQKGVAAGRFLPDDPSMRFIAAGGTVMASLAAELRWGELQGREEENAPLQGLRREGMPARAAAAVLRILGLDGAEAAEIASRPLPSEPGDDVVENSGA
ncbi:TetR/AcrR family transcriptional regulator [Paludibacterium purpuratum]|uniref:TetR family transcriptional regulator n=1 Tax=Paludibacterium purpuratum TaxID=1144873 RepID=A0A4V3DUV8_9NEIS|nr:TetR/AcrR family transcriptional regulator [Paludibacterium purpuratum]TDR77857.1 TetR family transcriptional regulator [Paludibacterium purpuratum]